MKQSRRSGIKIISSLIVLLGSLAYIILLALINGSLGYLSAMGVTLFGSIAVCKALGILGLCSEISLSWGLIISLTIIFGIIRGLLRYIEQYSNHYIAFKLLALLRDKIFKALRKLAPAKLEGKKKGSIIAMITSDIETLEVFYAHTISPIAICVIVTVTILLLTGFIGNFYLSLLTLFIYLLIGIFSPLISSKKLKDIGVKYRREFASFNSYYLDSIKGVNDIVLNNNEQKRENEVNLRSNKLLKETKKIKETTSFFTAGNEALVTMGIILSTILGIILVKNKMLDLGKMIISLTLIFNSFGPVIAIASLPSNLTQTFASGERILNLLEEKPIVENIINQNDFSFNKLDVKNLSFGYEKDNLILKDIALKAEKGKIIGIVGDSGCGKSTLLKLLLRFYKKDDGYINYNDVDIENINTSSLLDNVTLVSQNTYLFDETIIDNLKIAKQDASLNEIIDSCKKASIHDFINSLPNGYQSKVGNMGDYLSSGEKQRIGLARAFLRNSKLILLDEPTSNVDSINEGIILKSLLNQKKNHAIILVSHRESTMAIADVVYKIEKGKIKEVNYHG